VPAAQGEQLAVLEGFYRRNRQKAVRPTTATPSRRAAYLHRGPSRHRVLSLGFPPGTLRPGAVALPQSPTAPRDGSR